MKLLKEKIDFFHRNALCSFTHYLLKREIYANKSSLLKKKNTNKLPIRWNSFEMSQQSSWAFFRGAFKMYYNNEHYMNLPPMCIFVVIFSNKVHFIYNTIFAYHSSSWFYQKCFFFESSYTHKAKVMRLHWGEKVQQKKRYDTNTRLSQV